MPAGKCLSISLAVAIVQSALTMVAMQLRVNGLQLLTISSSVIDW